MGGRFGRTEQIVILTAEPEFEYDPNKSDSNKEKHGIDFEEAKTLWKDKDGIILPSDYIGEDRYLLIANIDAKLFTAAFTIRHNRVRIISVRRSRKNEVEYYEKRH